MYSTFSRLTFTHRQSLLFSFVLYLLLSAVWIQFSHAQKNSKQSVSSTHAEMSMYYSLRSYGLTKSSSSWSKVYALKGTTLIYEYHLNSSMGENDEKKSQTKELSKSQISELVSLLKKAHRSFNEIRSHEDTRRILEATLQVKPDPKISRRLRGKEQMILKDRLYLEQFFPLEEVLNKLLSAK